MCQIQIGTHWSDLWCRRCVCACQQYDETGFDFYHHDVIRLQGDVVVQVARGLGANDAALQRLVNVIQNVIHEDKDRIHN